MSTSIINIKSITSDDLFEWFWYRVISDGGDGCGIIVCGAINDTANDFEKWCIKHDKHMHPKDEYNGEINFHDSNENFIFMATYPDNLNGVEYLFIVDAITLSQ